MKVAFIGDSHFDERSRFEECIRIHDWMAQDMRRQHVELVCHCGDVYERASTPDERRAVARWAQEVTKFAPLVVVKGNHDRARDLLLLEHLDTHFPVRVVEGAEVVHMGDAAIACVAWPRKASVQALAAQHGGDTNDVAGVALQQVLRGLGQQMQDHQGPKLLAAHAMVRGSTVSTGQPLVGSELELGVDDLRLAGADFYALGHVHMPQQWTDGPGDVVYTGSPRRTAFGELEDKGYVLYDAGAKAWERIIAPCASMLLWESEWRGGAFVDAIPLAEPGAEYRLRYTVDADQREAAAAVITEAKRALLEGGAGAVNVEAQTRAVTTARAPEVAEAKTLADKLGALWKLRGADHGTREERLLSMVAELEEVA